MGILYGLLAVLVLLVAALLINTALAASKARKLQGAHPGFSDGELAIYGQSFARMLRCKTVSVQGSYDDAEFAKLHAVVEEEFPLLHEKAERKIFSDDCWLYKIPGKDESRNILLMSHHDVVAAEEENWIYEPFSGTIAEGKVYGRGAADTKGSLCAILFAAEELLKEGVQPPVNLYIASSHNEELGGDGMPALLAWFQEQNITLEVILDEGGAIVEPPLGNMNCEMCAMVAVHEKGRRKFKCIAKTESSHVSLTGYKGNPVERMSAFIHEITHGNLFVRRLNPQTKAMFAALGPYCSFPMNVLFANLWLFGGILKRVLPKLNATAGGMVGTTCNFQTIHGGVNDKICTVSVMLRNINPEDLEKELQAFRAVAEKYGIELEEERNEYYPPADMESPAYGYTMQCLAEIFPRYPAAPYILPAGTDAWRLSPVCSCVLRFAPTRMSKQQLGSIHAVNENLDIAAVAEAAAFYKHFVRNYP